MATTTGQWPLAIDHWPSANGYGQWPGPMAMAIGHGQWPWPLTMAIGHGHGPTQPFPSPAICCGQLRLAMCQPMDNLARPAYGWSWPAKSAKSARSPCNHTFPHAIMYGTSCNNLREEISIISRLLKKPRWPNWRTKRSIGGVFPHRL